MAEGTPKAIEMKGIVRNATKIGVQDGQAEDLINLRFMDGSWRASGNGRQIENMPTGTIYQQLYVHTNVYHHLLGVDNGTLYWFAEIDNDGVTFYPLDGTSDRSQWPEDKQDLPTERVALTTVTGSMWITQTGHLLTIIDEADDFEHFVFKTGTKEYIKFNQDINGKATDRKLYPFGKIHFNCYCPFDEDHICGGKDIEAIYDFGLQVYYDSITNFFKEKNQFAQPFMAVVAAKLYDGSFAMASNPIIIHPRERFNFLQKEGKGFINLPFFDPVSIHKKVVVFKDGATIDRYLTSTQGGYQTTEESQGVTYLNEIDSIQFISVVPYGIGPADNGAITFDPSFDENGKHIEGAFVNYMYRDSRHFFFALGSDLILSIDADTINVIKGNEDIISSLCIFATTESNLFQPQKKDELVDEGYASERTIPKGTLVFSEHIAMGYKYHQGSTVTINESYTSCSPKFREGAQIINDLMHSPFYFLREYKITELSTLLENPIVDLSTPEYEGLLKNLVQQNTLPTEAFSRTTYLPKVSYMYNGRLHIANYKSHPFFGYPIDLFHLHNHSVKVQDGAWFKGVLPNLADNNDAYLQYPRTQHTFIQSDIGSYGYGPGANVAASIIKSKGDVFAFIVVEIDTEQGLQKVVRYIKAYDTKPAVNGRADFIEDMNPLLTYPDARAKSMTVFLMTINGNSSTTTAGVVCWYEKFELKPHPYLNMAYYIDPDLKPIKLRSSNLWNQDANPNDGIYHTFENAIYRYLDGVAGVDYIVDSEIKEIHPFNAPEMQNTEEYFPNGLKVSKTDQPMFFPVENTYQVGSAEILALCVNTKAVGTGQTGAAPLFVFCKDGVYAQFVDASGQLAYPEARPVADDVCNNPRSVTRTDMGIVFSTDRGLMLATYDGKNFQIDEIGAPAEGDVVQFWNAGSVDYSKIATASMQQIAGLPSELCSTTDFLTYLQDKGTSGKAAIINYNHNMRELMVSNPNYPYSYVLDREGNWSRRDYTAAQYVNNYPTSYRVDANGHFYKVDDEGDANTSLEHRKEADNKIFYLSNVIKLDSIGFKQAYRFVVRGYFETLFANREMITDTIDGRKIIVMGLSIENMGIGEVLRIAYIHIYSMDAWVSVDEHGEVGNILTLEIYDALTLENITKTFRPVGSPSDYITLIKTETPERPAIACVVEGSYDGRKFKPLGYNRKSGKFRDIGCIVERTDVRFFRVCLSGQVTGKTRIDYMEMSADGSVLNTKIR